MAYIGKDEHTPVWLPESLPEEILAESFIELLNTEGRLKTPLSRESPTSALSCETGSGLIC